MEASGAGPVDRTSQDCFTCRSERDPLPPVRERILLTDHWRVAHAVGSALPGWLVVVPRVHARSLTELAAEALTELGPLLKVASTALQEVTGCLRTYLASFGEAPGFPHFHVHVVPRLDDHPPEWTGPAVFGALDRPEHLQVDGAATDLVAAQLVRVLARRPGEPRLSRA